MHIEIFKIPIICFVACVFYATDLSRGETGESYEEAIVMGHTWTFPERSVTYLEEHKDDWFWDLEQSVEYSCRDWFPASERCAKKQTSVYPQRLYFSLARLVHAGTE